MITGVKISRFRGVLEGEVTGLTPLTVLVGGNGSGKSAILEALYIGASPNPGDAVGKCFQRRIGVPHGFRWLLWKWGLEQPTEAQITLTAGREERNVQVILLSGTNSFLSVQSKFRNTEINYSPPSQVYNVTFSGISDYDTSRGGDTKLETVQSIRLLDPNPIWYAPLHRLHKEAQALGR